MAGCIGVKFRFRGGGTPLNAICITDLHAHSAWPFSRPLPSGRPSRFQDLLNVLEQVRKYLDQYHPDDLLIGGDLLHRRHFIQFPLYNTLMRAVEELTVRVKQTIILVGNHDWESGTEHSLYPFSHLPNTLVVDTPRVVSLASGEEGVNAIPYLPDSSDMVRAFDAAESSLPVFSHYAAEGVPLESDYWLEAPLKLGELAGFPLTLFGHIHKPSEQLDGRVVYVGAPMHFDFGDVGPRSCVRVTGHQVERLPLQAPVFVTTKWPRIPPPPSAGGYLRLLDVPTGKVVEAREAALEAKWLDAVALEGAVLPEVREAMAQGLVVDEGVLRGFVARRCPELSPDESASLVGEGIAWLEKARG